MKSRGTVLVVDDEDYVRDSIAAVLSRKGFTVKTQASADEAIRANAAEGCDVVLTDLRMPGTDALGLLRSLASSHPDLPVIVLTAHGTVTSAVECIRAGAFDYLLKPANSEELVLAVERALGQTTMRRELDYLRGDTGAGAGRGVIGKSPAWKRVLELVDVAAPTDTTVLLLGESGTGKEELARLIHRKSPRAGAALVSVNCAAIPLELFESEFFGHRRGAFTGAVSNRDGRFLVAHRGTLFLDELGCLPEPAQAKVLRVLEDGSFERLGDHRPTSVDVRLIAATNSDIEAEVEAGRFRRDLYYRINVLAIRIPPLRERKEDIAELARHFLAEFSPRLGKTIEGIHPAALDLLEGHHWPGNVRELRNMIERAVLLERGGELQAASLSLAEGRAEKAPSDLNLRAAVAAAERMTLLKALERAGGVRREAAKLLGIDERNLAYYLRKHDLMKWSAK